MRIVAADENTLVMSQIFHCLSNNAPILVQLRGLQHVVEPISHGLSAHDIVANGSKNGDASHEFFSIPLILEHKDGLIGSVHHLQLFRVDALQDLACSVDHPFGRPVPYRNPPILDLHDCMQSSLALDSQLECADEEDALVLSSSEVMVHTFGRLVGEKGVDDRER